MRTAILILLSLLLNVLFTWVLISTKDVRIKALELELQSLQINPVKSTRIQLATLEHKRKQFEL